MIEWILLVHMTVDLETPLTFLLVDRLDRLYSQLLISSTTLSHPTVDLLFFLVTVPESPYPVTDLFYFTLTCIETGTSIFFLPKKDFNFSIIYFIVLPITI